MKSYAYLLDDQSRPPALHEIRGEDPETGLMKVSPCNNPGRVLYLCREDLWILC